MEDYSTSISCPEFKIGAECLIYHDRNWAASEGLPVEVVPHYGYCYKVLEAQGNYASGGRKSFFDESGNMTNGYALVACPVKYGVSGRHTFIVNQDGIIFKSDLGPDTHRIYATMSEFDPSVQWKKIDVEVFSQP